MKVVLTFFLGFFFSYASSQRCGIEEYMKNFGSTLRVTESPVSVQNGRDTLPDEVIVIPVVVHVLYHTSAENISDQQILSQIISLNNDFRRKNADALNTPAAFTSSAADTRIVFCLANVDPNGYKTSGIIRKYVKDEYWLSDDEMKFSSKGGDNAWDASQYLNIWVCNLFGRTLGYGVFPGGPPERDGLVIQYNVFGTTGTLKSTFNKGRTATHEIGHWLGLKHIWGDADCGDDGIGDTPQQQTSNSYCPTFPHKSLCSADENGDMYMNYMDFTDDACMNLFTKGQKSEMRSQFAVGGARNSFLMSAKCDSSGAQGAPVIDQSPATVMHISVFPNPFTTQITINSSDPELIGMKFEIFDITGRRYLSAIISSQKTVVPVSQLKPGVYLLKIAGSQGSQLFKVIRQAAH